MKLKYIGRPEYFDGIYFIEGMIYSGRFYKDGNRWIVEIGYPKKIKIPYNCNPIGRYWEYC